MTCSICNTKRGWRTMVDGQGLLFCLPLPAFLAHILNVSGISLQFEDRVVTLCFGKSRNHFRDAIDYILFRTSIDWWRSRDVGTLASSCGRYPRDGSFNLPQRSEPRHHPTHNACQRGVVAIARQRKQQSHLGKSKAFFGSVARALSQVLAEYGRKRKRVKRGGGTKPVSLQFVQNELGYNEHRVDDSIVALTETLQALSQVNERAEEVARMKYILGLSTNTIASMFGVSDRTIRNDWMFAQAWLRRELSLKFGTDQ